MALAFSHFGNSLFLFTLCGLMFVFTVMSTNFKGSFDADGAGTFMFVNPMTFHGQMLGSSPIHSKEVFDETECLFECSKDSQCRSTNFQTTAVSSGKFLCQILDTDKFISPELINGSLNHRHHSLSAPCEFNPCMNGATCKPIKTHHDFKCICPPAYQSCAELLNAGYSWTMVFKVVSGVQPNIYELWTSANLSNEDNVEVLNTRSSPPFHYKNRLVANWQTAEPKEVRVAVYENSNEVFSIVFNATNSNKTNWFSLSRMISSPWTDLSTNPPTYFSLPGKTGRYFYIAGPHVSCETDSGWFLVAADYCAWEKRFPRQTVLYSKLTTSINRNDNANMGVADVMIVFIR